MCTLTWFLRPDGYELFFNRDESVTRSRATPPNIGTGGQDAYISPTDTDAGGTWISLNQYGVSVCLLNYYQFEQRASYQSWTSRGNIVRLFANSRCLRVTEQQFLNMELDNYRAFRMFIITPEGGNRLCVWDGHAPRVETDVSPLKSSSAVNAAQVKTVRSKQFDSLGLAQSRHAEDFLRYHASHLPTKSIESVCMHCPEANTVSLSHLRVSMQQVEFRYADGPPCTATLGSAVTLPRLVSPPDDCSSPADAKHAAATGRR